MSNNNSARPPALPAAAVASASPSFYSYPHQHPHIGRSGDFTKNPPPDTSTATRQSRSRSADRSRNRRRKRRFRSRSRSSSSGSSSQSSSAAKAQGHTVPMQPMAPQRHHSGPTQVPSRRWDQRSPPQQVRRRWAPADSFGAQVNPARGHQQQKQARNNQWPRPQQPYVQHTRPQNYRYQSAVRPQQLVPKRGHSTLRRPQQTLHRRQASAPVAHTKLEVPPPPKSVVQDSSVAVWVANMPASSDAALLQFLFQRFNPRTVEHSDGQWMLTFFTRMSRDAAISHMNGFVVAGTHTISVRPLLPQHSSSEKKATVAASQASQCKRAVDEAFRIVTEALIATVSEKSWRDVVEAPVFEFLEEWSGKPPAVALPQQAPSTDADDRRNAEETSPGSEIEEHRHDSIDTGSADPVPEPSEETDAAMSPVDDIGTEGEEHSANDDEELDEKPYVDDKAEDAASNDHDSEAGESDSSADEGSEDEFQPSCAFCSADDDRDQMAICSFCSMAQHVYCMQPPLRRVPRVWSCTCCAEFQYQPEPPAPLSVEGPDSIVVTQQAFFLNQPKVVSPGPPGSTRPLRRVSRGRSSHVRIPVHKSGSVRTEGFYVNSNMNFSGRYLPHDSSASSKRSVRAQRRRVQRVTTNISSSSVLQANQLKARKKKLKLERSKIHAWGVRTMESIPEGDLIIEYIGEYIRPQVADHRERQYERSGIGSTYLFKVSDDLIIDATKKGNIARYLNHSCEPNCKTKVVTVNNSKRVVVYSKRAIYPGEELTYDYKLSYEPHDEIECLCGSRKCRGYL